MHTSKNYVYDQHFENFEWLNKLFFYKDEISVLQARLQEVAALNNSREFLAQLEHLQNQLIVQRDLIDRIKHDVNENEEVLEKNISENPVSSDHRKVDDHIEEREVVLAFDKNFHQLRKELNTFFARWL